MGVLTFFVFDFFGRDHIDWPITNFFWNIGHFPIEALLWSLGPQIHKIETNVLHYGLTFQLTYIGVEL
jgi:hypothetical protein